MKPAIPQRKGGARRNKVRLWNSYSQQSQERKQSDYKFKGKQRNIQRKQIDMECE